MFINTISLKASSAPVKAATIFQSSTAELTRPLAVDLKTGKNVVEISGISHNVDADSPRVTGAGDDVHVLDIVCRRKPRHAPDAQEDETSAEIRSVTSALHTLEAERQVRSHEITLIDDSARLVTTKGDHPSPDGRLLEFVKRCVAEKLAVRKEIQRLDAEINELNKKLWLLRNARKGAATTVISVTLVAKQDCKANLKLTYLVSGVSWQPFYDLHATTAEGQPSADVSLHYCATISQDTGEDWVDAALTLSTANARALKQLAVPSLNPLKIRQTIPLTRSLTSQGFASVPHLAYSSAAPPVVIQPPPASAIPPAPIVVRSRRSRSSSAERAHFSHEVDRARVSPSRSIVSSPRYATHEDARAAPVAPERSALSVAYRVRGTVSLPSDGQEHKLTVAILDLKSTLNYESVPRESQAAFIVCQVKNTSEYDLLAGPVHVFMNDSFVTKTSVGFIPVGESFGCVLGVDTSLKVSYRKDSKTEHEPRRNFAEPHKTTKCTAVTTIRNQHTFDIAELIVRDAIPLGNDDSQVAVSLRKPEGLAKSKDGEEVSVSLGDDVTAKARWTKVVDGKGGEKDGLYEWVCSIPAGKTVALEAQWDVKAPSDYQWEETA
ncbi:hypothetical protein OH77DRAFT_1400184 [Trametes cingulata]|nr:hypothetical protein OH77DRAFT_1400184 [Trametes cingulata]